MPVLFQTEKQDTSLSSRHATFTSTSLYKLFYNKFLKVIREAKNAPSINSSSLNEADLMTSNFEECIKQVINYT